VQDQSDHPVEGNKWNIWIKWSTNPGLAVFRNKMVHQALGSADQLD
jgi:hypothetical protein